MLRHQIISFITSRGKPQKTQPNGLSPSLPLELIYKLVDDHVSPSNDLRTARALALTCKALAGYCRPLLFRVVHLEYYRPPFVGPHLLTSEFPCKGKPDRFLQVARSHPDVLHHIHHLSLHFDAESAARRDAAGQSPWELLTDLLSLTYLTQPSASQNRWELDILYTRFRKARRGQPATAFAWRSPFSSATPPAADVSHASNLPTSINSPNSHF
jgi:hypothetical protein